MSTGSRVRTIRTQPAAEEMAERRRMSFCDLFFLAAGGVIGSGWLRGAFNADNATGALAVFSWLIGGALMLVIAAVMVELSAAVPKTGGLVFLPLQSSGPLLATVLAAALWVWYAVTPASEAVAMVGGLPTRIHGLAKDNGNDLTGRGMAALFLILIAGVNLLGPRLFIAINNALTGFKIAVPVLIIGLLGYAMAHLPGPLAHAQPVSTGTPQFNLGTVLSTLASSGVMYAYLGFQGPLTFAGSVRRRGVGEAARLRWAVYGTVCGSILLYVSLQFVVIYSRHHLAGVDSYAEFAARVAPGWAGTLVSDLIKIDLVLSPAGAGMVFTYVLTREVAALSRAHLTHRGLQKSRYSVIPVTGGRLRKLVGDDRLDVYWLILIVDVFVSGIFLVCFGGKWSVLGPITSMLALIIYSTQSVVLASLRRREPWRFPRVRYPVLAEVGFVAIAIVLVLTSWGALWRSMAALTMGCLLLFGLPLVFPAARGYDATAHALWFRRRRAKNSAAGSAVLLFGCFAGLTIASLVKQKWWPPRAGIGLDAAGVAVIAGLAWLTFRRLVTLSERYMDGHPPTLPTPVSGPAGHRRRGRGTATGRSG
jgi:amino acid transporter